MCVCLHMLMCVCIFGAGGGGGGGYQLWTNKYLCDITVSCNNVKLILIYIYVTAIISSWTMYSLPQ